MLDMEAQEAWAESVYDQFRATDRDIDRMVAALADVPRPDGSRGFSRAEIAQIKNHLFRAEHPLTAYDDDGNPIGTELRRYDADADIAEAWMRISLGRPLPEDIVLLEHELAEAHYYAAHPARRIETHIAPRTRPTTGNRRSRPLRARTSMNGEPLMAIYLVFRLESETETEVTYRFGGADHRFDRALTINKTDHSVTVADGKLDTLAAKTAGKALSRYRRDGTWMTSGNIQA